MGSKSNSIAKHLNALFLMVGIALFAGLILRTDLSGVMVGLRRVGPMFIPAFLCYVGSQLCSTYTWKQCIAPPSSTASYGELLRVFWAGHALNAVTPGGGAGELLKGNFLKGKIPGAQLASSLILYNVVQAVAIASATVIGASISLLALNVPTRATLPIFLAACVIFTVIALGLWLIRRNAVAKIISLASKLPGMDAINRQSILAIAQQIDSNIAKTHRERPGALIRAMSTSLFARVLQVAEVYFLLKPILTEGPILLIAILMQTTSQLIVWLMAFVPGRIGVLEGGNMAIFKLAGLDPSAALTVIIAKRLRTILGVSIGILLGGHWVWGGRDTSDNSNL